MTEAYIYDAVRTPRGKGKKDGSLHEVKPIDLLTPLFGALRERNNLDTAKVEDVVLGCVTPIGEQGGNIARIAVLYAGWDQAVPGQTLNRFCASGLEAVNLAAAKVGSGQEDLVVAGGVESMSRIKMSSDGGAWFLDPRINGDTAFIPQGVSADLIATLEGFPRAELDAFAARSHRKAAHARDNGHFDNSLIPVRDLNGLPILEVDETIRPETTPESIAKLKPSFQMPGEMGFDLHARRKYPQLERIEHVHHAGNSSGIVDGAALTLIGNGRIGEELGLRPRARIRGYAAVGDEPTIMLTGPAPASRKALGKAGLTAGDIDLWEINEAFAAVVLKAQRELGIDEDRINVNGGAIALGHPLGATGAMLLGTAVDELERRDKQFALVTLCVGAGMGVATVIERI
ncbi:acetyl-CoA C-acetyltransferase [Sulfidibacter corallicola]|uniref:Acetyl-CoA C-acetyltransferase n=1 Tax=Sulfidibacter corallicola TaxID=2818388 RepID=A0A8A4TL69_SULCO|nr:acetyl-CoA C-acetyltransferase [Sulfidibacter corallicola]QTD50323.1 acetyl-CoA C-acetyltransferase [Sulfidibacter corallicola]